MSQQEVNSTILERTLGLKDLILLIVGTVIGSGIFIVPGAVLRQTNGWVALPCSWLSVDAPPLHSRRGCARTKHNCDANQPGRNRPRYSPGRRAGLLYLARNK